MLPQIQLNRNWLPLTFRKFLKALKKKIFLRFVVFLHVWKFDLDTWGNHSLQYALLWQKKKIIKSPVHQHQGYVTWRSIGCWYHCVLNDFFLILNFYHHRCIIPSAVFFFRSQAALAIQSITNSHPPGYGMKNHSAPRTASRLMSVRAW